MNSIDDPRHDREVGARDSTLDTTRIDDVRIGAVRPLITPALLQERVPCAKARWRWSKQPRRDRDVLHGRDDRLVVVVGPCSIHDHDQALEYAHGLKAIADELRDDLFIVMRAYFEKPRTTVGWKGYINDPHLDGSFAINEGPGARAPPAARADDAGPAHRHRVPRPAEPAVHRRPDRLGRDRRAHHRKPEPPPARVGLSCPVGFKNGTDGSIKVAADAILARGAARLHGHDQDGHGRDLRDPRQRRLPRDPARRQDAELRRRARRASCDALRSAGCASR
jgi:3-deoxy-7-phosphoheptulonate synthase